MHGTTALVFFCDGAGREAVVRGGGFRSTFSWRDGKRGISPSSVGVLLIHIFLFSFIIRHLLGVMENVEVFARVAL